MYRIHFDPRCSSFVVQMLFLSLFWRTCHVITMLDDGTSSDPVQFGTYDEARAWVKSIGLDKAYPEQHSCMEKQIYTDVHGR